MSNLVLGVKSPHHEFSISLECECYFCSKWRRWLETRKRAEAASKGHKPGCSCKLCKLTLYTRQSTLAAELRLNVWIELSWYAELEGWAGWETQAIRATDKPDRWWITDGQYRTMDYWLGQLADLGAETRLYDYKTA